MHPTLQSLLVICGLCLPQIAPAQDRAGNDTPGEWVVNHQKPFGLWDSVCDHRVTGNMREERCYLRYVQVFSPRPKFAAQFAFVTKGPAVDFGMEAGTLFAENGFRIETNDITTWAAPHPGCLIGLACLYEGPDATTLLTAMSDGDVFRFDFIDRHGTKQSLHWGLKRFRHALADFNAQSALRGLQ